MQEQDGRIQALNELRSRAAQASSPATIAELLTAYAREQLGAESIELEPSHDRSEAAASSKQLSLEVADHTLTFHWHEPYSDAQKANAEIAAALVAASPAFPNDLPTIDLALLEINGSLDVTEVAKRILSAIEAQVPCDEAAVFLLENEELKLRSGGINLLGTDQAGSIRTPPEWGNQDLLHELLGSENAVCLNDVMSDSRWDGLTEEDSTRAWMGVRLSNGELQGAMVVRSTRSEAFQEGHKRTLTALAAGAGAALANAKRFEEASDELAELNTLYQASATMTANLDQDFVLEAVVTEMVRVLQADSCAIYVWEENSQKLVLAADHELNGSASPVEEDGRPILVGLEAIEDLAQHPLIKRLLEKSESYAGRVDDAQGQQELDFLKSTALKSALLLPLVRRDQILGLLALGQSSSPRTFDEKDLRLAHNLAGQAAVAIEHAHLFGQAKRRVEELSAFQEIVLRLNTPLNLNAVFDAITESALKLVDASNLHIYLYNANSNAFTFGSALWRNGRRGAAVDAPRANGLTATVVQRAEPVVINDASSHELYQADTAQRWGISAIAGFPLKHGDQILGVFTATYLDPHVFSPDELLLLNLLADQAAVAVRNAGLFAGSQRRLKDMAALVDMAKQVTGNLKPRDVLQTTVQILQGLLNARASTITMLSEDGSELVVVAAVGIEATYLRAKMKLGEGVSGEVVRTGELVYIRDAHSEANFLFFDEVVRSLLVVPLVIRDETIGTMAVDSARSNAFSDSDIQLMTIAAAQVSVAIANARFIEELEKRATELAIAYEELKESDRLKDELVQNVSHELRTPLTFVKGYVDLVLEGEMGVITPRQQDALDIVADKTTDITRLIEDIVTLQRISSSNLQREFVSLTELIETSVEGHKLVADRKGLRVTHSLPESGALVWVDRARINQVIDNLVGNAMKFSPDGGTISVSMMETEDEVQIVISDEGIGVPADKRERIFERFYQVDGSARRRFGGTGVGLAIVKRIVDAHQGKIWVESEVGQGSSFYVAFPRATVEPEPSEV